MFKELKTSMTRNITNARGWRINRKIVVFESDDWGSIRMRDKKTFENLLNAGIRVDKSRYDNLYSLETRPRISFRDFKYIK
jgi:hypothetical protein